MEEINELVKQRINKLNALRDLGIDPYGMAVSNLLSIKELVKKTDMSQESPGMGAGEVAVAGRLMAIRLHGKSAFCDIRDQSAKIQIYIKEDIVGKDKFSVFEKLDIGDIIVTKGELFKTRTGELTVKVTEFTLLSKSLRPLPEKWHGLKDIETRYRQRYVDLIVNDDVKNIFYTRSRMITDIRQFLDSRGYLEVETPMMHSIAGGAAGKPFKTHHEALGMDLYLRIAPELYLKKLLVGGFEKVYEINRSFRNEGISIRHNPEFTMLEVYTAYSDCGGTMRLTEELIRFVAREVLGKEELDYQGQKIDLTRWERVSFADLMKENFDIGPEDDTKLWIEKLGRKGVNVEKGAVSRTQVLNIIGDLIEPKAKAHPVFVVDIFTELCPLAKTKKENPLLTDRFELFIAGMEIANAYSELNDPIEQRKRFEEQAETEKRAQGAPNRIDEDFVRALEYGMPPAGGLGIGIDRLAMVLTNSPSIRDVIFFPQMRPE
ncbi:MAG: lysine--tRNA ligase [Candidatus Omnitrophica bacterium]|nr:lysine--tRNA ligase [Candidatus Omnitrophota bacterium]